MKIIVITICALILLLALIFAAVIVSPLIFLGWFFGFLRSCFKRKKEKEKSVREATEAEQFLSYAEVAAKMLSGNSPVSKILGSKN